MAASIEAKPRREVPLGWLAGALLPPLPDTAELPVEPPGAAACPGVCPCVTGMCATLTLCMPEVWLAVGGDWPVPADFSLSDSCVVSLPPGASVLPDWFGC